MNYCIGVNKPFMAPKEEIILEISRMYDAGIFTNFGPQQEKLRTMLMTYLNIPNITLFSNGHAALENAISAFEFAKGSEIITTPYTFISTINAIIRCGMKPVFCDIRKEDFQIDAKKIPELITSKTVAIMPVHLFGMICDVEEIDKIAKKYSLKILYDAAHAFGVKYKGKSIATYGDATMFSFHASKILNTIEGGAVCCANKDLAERMSIYSNFGISGKYALYVGENAKMSEMHASVGLCNLRYVQEEIQRRKQIFSLYEEYLGNEKDIHFPVYSKNMSGNYSYLPLVFDGRFDRNRVAKALEERGIDSRKSFYPLSKFVDQEIPIANYVASHILTLPMYGELTKEQVHFISEVILTSA